MGIGISSQEVENPMEKERQHEMETGVMQGASAGS